MLLATLDDDICYRLMPQSGVSGYCRKLPQLFDRNSGKCLFKRLARVFLALLFILLCGEAGREIVRKFPTLIMTGRMGVCRATAGVELLLPEVLGIDEASILTWCIAATPWGLFARRGEL